MTLTELLTTSERRNEWLTIGPMQVYVRTQAYHLYKDSLIPFFDIASVGVDPAHRGKGHFSRLLQTCEELTPRILVENVLNPRLAAFLKHRGYISDHRDPPSFMRVI